MRFATIQLDGESQAVVDVGNGVVPIRQLNEACGKEFPTSLFELIQACQVSEIKAVLGEAIDPIPYDQACFEAPFRRPGKIWGIGLNYREHAGDLDESAPDQPASFNKPPTAIIGPGDSIVLPKDSGRVTGEAELGVIIGKRCRKITEEEAESYIFGYTTIIDMTALDILQQNPRYLTRSKSFDSFFSFGPFIVTPDEVNDLMGLEITTLVNNEVIAKNVVANMTHDPFKLVSFHSQMMTMEPGDIISTGTPGAGIICAGDVVRCEITGFHPLENPVVDDE